MSGWTQERIETAKSMLKDGESYGAIAATLGMTKNSVIGKMHRLGVKQGIPKHPRANITRRVRAAPGPRTKYFKPMEPRKPALTAPPSKQLGIHQLTAHLCRYIAEPEPPFTYCGHVHKEGSPYCQFHHDLCHISVSMDEANRRAARAARGT